MAVNLSRNGPALQAAYRDVLNDKTATDWALFTYEGNSNDLRVAGTGDGGLEELVEELNSGKVMYAFCRVKDPNSGLPKCVLINWTGEGVKDARKGLCANHVSTIASFLKGAHVTINARDDQDVEPEVIIEKVAKASGANYSFHKESSRFQDKNPQGPVGSVYKKTNAMSEIRSVDKESFWAQTERDEERRREEDKRRKALEQEGLEKERKERERRESELREKQFREKSSQIDQQRQFQKKQESESHADDKQRWKEQEQEYQEEMRKGFKRSQSIEKEAASIISQRSVNPKELFKERERGNLADPSSFNVSTQPESPPRVEERVEAEPEEQQTDQNEEKGESKEGYSWQFHHSETLEHEDIYQDPEEHTEEPVSAVTEDQAATEDQGVYDAVETQMQGLCARALYDYQAADETEISFDPDDIITNIEQIDEGWWRGYAANGSYGMFPANYVELLNC
ncbi:drebrin-like b isoform X5 [Hypanus sabinus]|uniref:drebrin-like b isoform X5 n=1 Tax=Hypanus sabinus TaxID=79690 RepID=UPI0028C37C5C|nr:drebrin-like b isoform X5 [Hypanus sabinus]